jgi:dihydropteroate synthase
MKPSVARAAIEAGALMINDVSGFADPEMRKIAAYYKVPLCLMHMHGSPKTMQNHPYYPEGIIPYLLKYFKEQTALLIEYGVPKDKIIIDPGIGFGKTVADNLEIIHNLHRLKDIGYPILLGISRKSFLSKLLNKPSTDLLAATLAVNALGIIGGVDIIRVHDVQEHRDIIEVLGQIYSF